jgi:hypothetical protein
VTRRSVPDLHPPPHTQYLCIYTELALKERQLGEVTVDDLARCLMDAQQVLSLFALLAQKYI